MNELVDTRRIVICCGTGGVGKTTTAAVIALEGARRGRNSCVVTIDPARRLADALGLAHLSNDPTDIRQDLWRRAGAVAKSGRFSALMLDTKSTFDLLRRTTASSPEQAHASPRRRLRPQRLGTIGTKNDMAMGSCTAPRGRAVSTASSSTHPRRVTHSTSSATKHQARLLTTGVPAPDIDADPRTCVASVAGTGAFHQDAWARSDRRSSRSVVAFFRAFEGMEGFGNGQVVGDLLGDHGHRDVLVGSPRRGAVTEATFFAGGWPSRAGRCGRWS